MTPKKGERLFLKDYGNELIVIATEDLESAHALFVAKKGGKENIVFMVQQAIEKSLKAVLTHHEIPVPLLVHDLGALVGKLPDGIEAPFGYELARYNDYAVLLRYERGHNILSEEDLTSALEVGTEVINWAKIIINSK